MCACVCLLCVCVCPAVDRPYSFFLRFAAQAPGSVKTPNHDKGTSFSRQLSPILFLLRYAREQDTYCTCNLRVWHVRVTIVVMETQHCFLLVVALCQSSFHTNCSISLSDFSRIRISSAGFHIDAPNITFYGNPSRASRAERTDMTKLVGTSRDCADAPDND
jgi:hypothetical protein